MALPRLADSALQSLLNEDVPYGDVTTEALGIGACHGELTFLSRRPTVACGTEEAARLFELCGASANVHAASGSQTSADAELITGIPVKPDASIKPGDIILEGTSAELVHHWDERLAELRETIVAALEETK